MPPSYELFNDGICNKKLPFNDYSEEFNFGQFVSLYAGVTSSDGTAHSFRVIYGSDTDHISRTRMRSLTNGVRPVDTLGGIPISAMLSSSVEDLTSAPEAAHEIELHDIDEFLTTMQLDIAGATAKADLTQDAIQGLLSGQSVLARFLGVDNEEILVNLKAKNAPDSRYTTEPGVSHWYVSDLAAFILQPEIPGIDEKIFRLKLSPETIRSLRTKGYAEADASEQTVVLTTELPEQTTFLLMRRGAGEGAGGEVPHQDDPPPKNTGGSSGSSGGSSGTGTPSHAPPPKSGGGTGGGTSTPGTNNGPPPREPLPDDEGPQGLKLALFLPWKQKWTLLGYTRGRLLHTLSLAPQEETTIEIFSWDRRKRTLEQSSSTETEQSFDQTDTTRDTRDVYAELTKSNDFQLSAGGNVEVVYDSSPVKVTAGAKVDAQSKDALNSVSRDTINHFQESVAKSATRVKVSRSTHITESIEQGREERVTRKVRNANMCHTLNLDYFEVESNYEVSITFNRNEACLCAMIENPFSRLIFDRNAVRIHEKTLRNALLDANLAEGFAAARLLYSREQAFFVICDKVHCKLETAQPPPTTSTQQQQVPATKEWTAVQNALVLLGSITFILKNATLSILRDWKEHFKPSLDHVTDAKRYMYLQLLNRHVPTLLEALLPVSNISASASTPAIASRLFSALPGGIQQATLSNLDTISTDAEKELCVHDLVDAYSDNLFEYNWFIGSLKNASVFISDDAGLMGALDQFRAAYQAYATSSGTQATAGAAQQAIAQANKDQSVQEDTDQLNMAFPLMDVVSAIEREDALLQHLNLHNRYYQFALFQSLPPTEQVTSLAANLPGLTPGQFQPRAVSSQGAMLAIPVNLILNPQLQAYFDDLISDVGAISQNLTQTVSLPTAGISLESRLGQCSSCEDFIERTRDIDLRQRTAIAEQAEAESRRMHARIGSTPPDLTDPKRPLEPLLVRLESTPAPAP